MSTDIERNVPRSFTGLTDEEWHQFDTVVKSFLGRGKRSLFLCILIKKTVEQAKWEYEKSAEIDQRAKHSALDSLKAIGYAERIKI